MSKELSEYPKELTEGRNAVEASFIFCLWKQPDLYSDYSSINENNDETIKTEDGIFYYSLGKQLYKQGFKAFDNVSVYTFLEDKPTVKKHFDKLGGYKTVEELRSLVDVENIDAYFDQIAKSNTLMMLHDKGFPVLPNIKKFARMTNQEVYDYYDYLLNSISLNTGHDAAIEDLVIDQAYIDRCDAGEEMGLNYGKVCHILNYLTMGLPLGEMTMLAGFSGVGKALAVTEPILTPTGFKLMGDIKLGDKVIGEDGKACNVIGVFPQGKRKAYRVSFKDGSSVICDKEHLWKFQVFKDRMKHRGYRIDTLENMMTKYPLYSSNGQFNLSIPVQQTVSEFAQIVEKLPLDPYVLGVLIGDGYIKAPPITLTNTERDIIDKMNQRVSDIGFFRDVSYSKVGHPFTRIGNHNKLINILRDLDLYGKGSEEKFIPKMYLFASVEDRYELLQGLIDTDGNVNHKGQVSFSSRSEQLIDDICFLIRSLGFRCSKHMYDRKEKGIDYEVNIYGKSDKIFSSKKHTERYNNVTPKRYYNYDCLRITNIEELDEEVEMQCIMVDNKTHTYLCNDFIVTHNTSFVFENMVIPLVEQDIKVAIISNEQRIHSFQQLLLVHILTQDLDYWELTRKKLKAGHFTDSQKEMLNLAQQISKEKYPNIKFVKLFDSDMGKAKKIIRKLSKLGYQAAIYDTLKVEDSFDRSTWEQLLIQSRQLFQLASKENIALVTTFQLALSTLNKRWLDAGCLSNGKQVKEVYSEMIYLRQIWDDEYTGEKHDCKAYRLKRDANGKLTKVKEMITLDKDKKYLVAFLDKTRNDEDKQTILYEWNGRFNKWTEIGYCTIYNDHAA